MSRLLKKLFFIFLPIGVYLGIFVYFEPYNYFGIKTKNYDPDSAIGPCQKLYARPGRCYHLRGQPYGSL